MADSSDVSTSRALPVDDVDHGEFIRDGDHILILLPSTNQKLVQLSSKEWVRLGKFGKFRGSEIVGHPFGLTYEIKGDGTLVVMARSEEDDAEKAEQPTTNNRNIIDCDDHQRLSHEKIKEMSSGGQLSGQEIISTLIENHATFEQKTEFSKAKYVRRKEQKFLKQLTTCRPTAQALCDYWFEKNSIKIRDIRSDMLSLLLTSANVHAGSRILVADDTAGMVTAAVAERMGGHGEIVVLHEKPSQNLGILPYMNLSDAVRKTIHTVPYARVFPLDADLTVWEEEGETREAKHMLTYRELQSKVLAGGFDGLIIATGLDVMSVLQLLVPYVATSRPVVAFSTSQDMLAATFQHMRMSKSFMLVDMLTTWYRSYQVLSQRTHPHMNMSGHGGFLVVGTYVDGTTIHQTSLTKEEISEFGRSTDKRRNRGDASGKKKLSSATDDVSVKRPLESDGGDEENKRSRTEQDDDMSIPGQ
ncbi:tRNA (adenine(58)-N(1))-methyltransferase non-catalytic subunit trm6 [Sorochytrium milnesiophthora]